MPNEGPFSRQVSGIDASPEAIEAARQGLKLAPGLPVTLVQAVDILDGAVVARDLPALAHLRRARASETLEEARRMLGEEGPSRQVEIAVEEGHVPDVLRYELGDDVRALLTLGTRAGTRQGGRGRPVSREPIVIRTLREVRCSTLVARKSTGNAAFPTSIVVGLDGSQPAWRAYDVATCLAGIRGAELHVVVALGGKGADVDALRADHRQIRIDVLDDRDATAALLDAASRSDLLVTGHRGLHGLRALGSVSERLVSTSPISVLVVRWQPQRPESRIG